MAKQCAFCFQFKDPLIPVLPSMPTRVCKACGYKLGQAVGFLQYHHAMIAYQPPLLKETPPDPPDPLSPKKKEPKESTQP